MKKKWFFKLSSVLVFVFTGAFSTSSVAQSQSGFEKTSFRLQLDRAARPWEFASALGQRSGLFGKESGELEGWVYPLKLFRNFHLRIRVDGEIFDAKDLVRSVSIRPESTTIRYAWDTFSLQETLFAPIDEPGAVIQIETNSTQPIEVEAVFTRDFELEWPGTMGGSDIEWNSVLHAFSMDETQHRFTALIGSPDASVPHLEFNSNYSKTMENSFSLGVTPPGQSSKLIIIAASFSSLPAADVTFRKLSASYKTLLAGSAAFYQNYIDSHVFLTLPDKDLESAYMWAQVSVMQGLVQNPYLGIGLVAGYKASSDNDQRPGYAWFFGRDALWTSFALNAEGDFSTTRTALEFLTKFQRKDGKIAHEIAQGATFVPWFESMPYAYASADATPLYIVAMEDYVSHSGDVAFALEKWQNLQLAYQFLTSTYDTNRVPKNEGVGHGWVEGGPLLPVKNELYQASVATEALRSLAFLAQRVGKIDESRKLMNEFATSQNHLNSAFWLPDASRFAFALDSKDQRIDIPSVLSTVPMWFGLLDDAKADSMIRQIDGPQIQTPWGMRIIGEDNPKYDAAGYHSGTVWPLFTGWASVGEYRYHEALPAYDNLRSNALLTFDGALGHVAEVLSGSYYQTLASASPHQIWSSAMVISPILKGMFGITEDALSNRITVEPHVPASWTSFSIRNLSSGSCRADLTYSKGIDLTTYVFSTKSGSVCSIDLAPAFSLRTRVTGVEMDGHKVPFRVQINDRDQHVAVHFDLSAPSAIAATTHTVALHLKNDFGLDDEFQLPDLGSTNEGIRVISEKWNSKNDELTLDIASVTGGKYQLGIWNPSQIKSVQGGDLTIRETGDQLGKLSVVFPTDTPGIFRHQMVVLHFRSDGVS